MSGIIEVTRKEGRPKGYATCTLRKVWRGESRVPDRYSIIKEGIRVPVISGDLYDIWEIKEGKSYLNRVIIGSHGELVGPMIFRKIEDRTIFDVVKTDVRDDLDGFGMATFVGVFIITIAMTLTNLILLEATELSLPVSFLIALLSGAGLSVIAGLVMGSSVKGCAEFKQITVSCDVPDGFYPSEDKQ